MDPIDGTHTVLVCDDDELLREFYARVLKSLKYNVITASNGDEAIEYFEDPQNKISLAILDLMMPIRSGWELIQWMKSRPQFEHIPVIAISGLSNSDESELIRQYCVAILNKGELNLKVLMQLIRDNIPEDN